LQYRIKIFVARVMADNTRMLDVFDESGFKMTKRYDEGVYIITFDLEKLEEFTKRKEQREHIASTEGMRRLLYPKSAAVIGALRDQNSVGGKVFSNLLYSNFGGTIYPVQSEGLIHQWGIVLPFSETDSR
jgi:hypothetical protein